MKITKQQLKKLIREELGGAGGALPQMKAYGMEHGGRAELERALDALSTGDAAQTISQVVGQEAFDKLVQSLRRSVLAIGSAVEAGQEFLGTSEETPAGDASSDPRAIRPGSSEDPEKWRQLESKKITTSLLKKLIKEELAK